MTRIAPLAVRLHGAAATFDAGGQVFAQLAIAAAQPMGFELLRLEVLPGTASAVFRADTYGAERWFTQREEVCERLQAFLEVAHRAATGNAFQGPFLGVTRPAEPELIDRLLRRRPLRRFVATEGRDEAPEAERTLALSCTVTPLDALDPARVRQLRIEVGEHGPDATPT